MPAARRPTPRPAAPPAPRAQPRPAPAPARPAPRPAPRPPAPRPAPAKPAQRPRTAPQPPKRAAVHPVPAARKPPVARGARPGAKPTTRKLPAKPRAKPAARKPAQKRKPATREHAKRIKHPAAKTAGRQLHWYQVWASEESDGGSGCNSLPIFSGRHGYSELSLDPRQPPCTASGPFNALGTLPCLTQMYIRNASTHHGVQVPKIDNGCGSTYNSSNPRDWPSCGLYPQTVRDLGLTPGAGRHLVHIARVDGSPMQVGNGIPIGEVGSPVGPAPAPAPVLKQLYFNPLAEAHVTPERIDDGVDYAGTGYYNAIADCKITAVVANGSGWEGEGYIEYQIVQEGPLKDKYVYYAEGVDPLVARGEFVQGGHHICRLRQPQPFGTEIGWAAGDGSERSWATVYGGGHHPGNCGTASGLSFSRLIQRLGGPGGILHCGPTGTYPQWTPNGQIPSTITHQRQTITGGTGPAPSNAQALAAKYKWPNNFWSAFWELHNGMGEASAHSHSAWFFARGIKYRTTKK